MNKYGWLHGSVHSFQCCCEGCATVLCRAEGYITANMPEGKTLISDLPYTCRDALRAPDCMAGAAFVIKALRQAILLVFSMGMYPHHLQDCKIASKQALTSTAQAIVFFSGMHV